MSIVKPLRTIDDSVIRRIASYRDAVRLCWDLRTRGRISRRQAADQFGCSFEQLADYLMDDEEGADLPRSLVGAFELACNNTVVSQYLARGAA